MKPAPFLSFARIPKLSFLKIFDKIELSMKRMKA